MRRLTIVLTVTMAALLAMGCASRKTVREKEAEIADLQQQVSGLEGQLENVEEQNALLQSQLESALAEYKEKEQVWLQQKENESIITVSNAVLFNSGSTTLSASGKDIVNRIAEITGQHASRPVRVEGHTDNKGIGPNLIQRYPSNWELSTGRACSVVHYMMKSAGVDPGRLSAVGYGEYRPIDTNDTADGRAANRRVVIVIGGMEAQTDPLP